MQWSTTDIHQIKAAIFDQAFIGKTWVRCPMGRVVAIRRRKGQLLAMIYGWGRWYPVEDVLIVVVAPPTLEYQPQRVRQGFCTSMEENE